MALNPQPSRDLVYFQKIQVQKQHIQQLTGWNKDLIVCLKVQDDIIDELRRENEELRKKARYGKATF